MATKIENWGFATLWPGNGVYAAPEQFRQGFIGLVNGQRAELPIDKFVGEKFVSEGVEYELGEPNPEFERQFPNAKERMLARFKQHSK